jgi:hypothetical protein
MMKCLVFAPGIMGSGLRDNQGSVWPPTAIEVIFGYNRVNALLNPNLTPTDPIQKLGPMGVYKSLLDDIAACGYSAGNPSKRFISFPYDWRQPNADTAQRLADLLDAEYPDPPPDLEITFLAHSMGGLVMRYVLESGVYDDRPWFPRIYRLITMGTPHFGASLSLFRLRGTDKSMGLSGPDIKRLANEPGFSSAFELVPPAFSALTTERPMPGDLPTTIDPFDPAIAARLGMNPQNIALARSFWARLDLSRRPDHVEYFFIVGSALKTNIRNEWINASQDPLPIERKSAGDGTVPIASALVVSIPHAFSQKKHVSIFTDRKVREYLYRFLDAPAHVHPQAAAAGAVVGASDAIGLTVNQEVYDPGEEIEVVVSFNEAKTDPSENFELASLDPETGDRNLQREPTFINVRLRGVSVSEFSFSVTDELDPGLYELTSQRVSDDPERTTFYVREVPQ